MKKFLSVLLAMIMVFTIASPVVFAQDTSTFPTIYISGQGAQLFRPDGTKIYEVKTDWAKVISDELMPLWKEVVKGVATGDYSEYCDKLCDIIIPIFADLKLGTDGEPTDGSAIPQGNRWNNGGKLSNLKRTIPTTTGSYPVYRYVYDWRLSPIELAEDLDGLVDAVLAETGAKKVNFVSRCLGSNIVYAYLHTYGTDKVASSVFYIPSINGISTAEAIYTGNIKLDANSVEKFVSFYSDSKNIVIKDKQTTDLLLAFIDLLEETKVLGVGLDVYQKIVDAIQVEALPRILKESYGTFPGMWTLVGADSYKQAREFVFGKEPDPEWAGLIEKIDAYYELQKDSDEFLKSISKDVKISVIAKYGFQMIPLSSESREDSDFTVSTRRLSFGATCCDTEKKFSTFYLNNAFEKGTIKYISADRKIDASTCLFPDRTWFVKDLIHMDFPDCVNDLIVESIKKNGDMNIYSDPAYTQYLQYTSTNDKSSDQSTGTITPIISKDDTYDATQNYSKNSLDAYFKFLKKLFASAVEFFKNLIRKPFEKILNK